MSIRLPRFADDRWYPSGADALRREVDGYLQLSEAPVRALGMVAPHAGYYYSGGVAGAIYGAVQVPDRVVVLAVNHRGLGPDISVWSEGAWRFPTGDVPVDTVAVQRLLAHSAEARSDRQAHLQEHSLEVQLPFLQRRNPQLSVVPVCLSRLDYDACCRLGLAIAASIRELPGDTLVVASSDMNHFESAEIGNRKDRLAIDRVLALDPQGLVSTVRQNAISMCGVIPTAVMLACVISLGASAAQLIVYRDSGDVSGDKTQVVGYAGIAVT